MTILATILCLALTRAELIERFRAAPIRQTGDMVEVWADCNADMRREFQVPIATFMGSICRELCRAERIPVTRFENPALIVHIGDSVSSNMTNVVVRVLTREDGGAYTRFYVPAPGFVDLAALRNETVKAFYRANLKRELTDAEAYVQLRKAIPELRIADDYAALEAWLRGDSTDDEKGLALLRTVIAPGETRRIDVILFASRLFLYPPEYGLRFHNGASVLSFREAIHPSMTDMSVRVAAYLGLNSFAALGLGHDERLTRACVKASEFLRDLAEGKTTETDLNRKLDEVEAILKDIRKEPK